MAKALRSLFQRVPNTYMILVGLFGLVSAALIVAVFVVGQITPSVVKSDYASIAATRKMRQAISGLRHPEDHPGHPVEYYIKQFDDNLLEAYNTADTPVEKELIERVQAYWTDFKKDPTHISIEKYRAMAEPLEGYVQENEKVMVSRLTRQERIRTIVSWGGILFFVLAWFV